MTPRRNFLRAAGGIAASPLFVYAADLFGAEPPPETRRIRIAASTALCFAPQIVARDLLQAEGFTEVEYRGSPKLASSALIGAGEADLSFGLGPNMLISADAGQPVVVLAGGHAGCLELFTTRGVRNIKDLKGREIAVARKGNGAHIFLSMMLAYVGIDPRKDVAWKEEARWPETVRLLAEEKVDAFLGFPPEPQELRDRKVGRVILNTTTDRPWAQYFCCMIGANRDFVARNPVATYRALRALLKGADLCSQQPDHAAALVHAQVPGAKLPYLAQMMKELPYGRWHSLNAEDSVRFYALRLHEIGMVKTSPQKLLAQATDWRMLDRLKNQLKA